MPTINESYLNAVLRHQVDLRRYTLGQVKLVRDLLLKSDADLARRLRERLARIPAGDYTSARLKKLLEDVRDLRRDVVREVARRSQEDVAEFAKDEADFEHKTISHVTPVEFKPAAADLRTVSAAVTSRPFQGRLLGQWWKTVEADDRRRVIEAVRLGVTNGEPVDDVVRRLVGTKAAKYADGALAITRRNAEAVVRTSISHISNAAREQVWDANEDVIVGLRWTATLDGRTTTLCASRDGLVAPMGDKPLPEGALLLEPPYARPPAHVNCRSTMVPVLDGELVVGRRPSVTDARTRDQREADFRAQAKREGRPIQDVRREWAEKNVGSVPRDLTYEKWLRTQDAAFQDEVLGPARAKLFREGGLKLTHFVDRDGTELSLRALRQRHPNAFKSTGVVPPKPGSGSAPVAPPAPPASPPQPVVRPLEPTDLREARTFDRPAVTVDDALERMRYISPLERDWHVSSFRVTDDAARRLLSQLPPVGVWGSEPSAFYRPHLGINMGRGYDDIADVDNAAVWRHEYGHHVDHTLKGERELGQLSASDRSVKALNGDRDELVSGRTHLRYLRDHADPQAALLSTFDELKAAVPGVSYAEIRAMFGGNMEDAYQFMRAALDKDGRSMTRILDRWTNSAPSKTPPHLTKHEAGNITDLFEATTRNAWTVSLGHGSGYYRRFPSAGSGYTAGHTTEAFANWFSTRTGRWQSLYAILRAQFFKRSFDEFERALQEGTK